VARQRGGEGKLLALKKEAVPDLGEGQKENDFDCAKAVEGRPKPDGRYNPFELRKGKPNCMMERVREYNLAVNWGARNSPSRRKRWKM